MSQTGESGDVAENNVRKWEEKKISKKFKGVKREDIPRMIRIIKRDMKLEEGADKFVETLQKMFNKSSPAGDTMKVLGDLNDDTMIFAIFYCIENDGDNDKINFAYVINTLSTDLPRKETRLNIAELKEFANPDLTQEMIEKLTTESETELENVAKDWAKRTPEPDHDKKFTTESDTELESMAKAQPKRTPEPDAKDAGDGGREVLIDGPSITFKCKSTEDDKLEVTILSCEDLPDLDGIWNLTDPYVIVKVGGQKNQTETIRGDINPKFDAKTSTFLFDNVSQLPLNTRIRFKVMDSDTFSRDDLIGEASIRLGKVRMVDQAGEVIKLGLRSQNTCEKVLSDEQITAIYCLFAALDRGNTGKLDPNIKSLVANPTDKTTELLMELDSVMADKDNSGDVSFAEFLEQFRLHEATPDTADINGLTEEFKEMLKGK